MPELNHCGCCSPSRLLEPKKNKKYSSAMLIGDRDGTSLVQKRPRTGCLQNCEEQFETELIQRRNSRDAIGEPQIGCTNHGIAAGNCNGHIHARISDTTEGVKSKSVCTKVYYRKNKRCRNTEDFQGKPANRNLDASHSETASCTGEEEIVLAGEIASHNLTSGREIDSEKSWFVSSLKENGLLHSERDGTIVSQTMTWTTYSPQIEKYADTIETRNDTQPIVNSQNGFTNKTSATEDSNDCKCANISGTEEDMRKGNICTRVYYRKSYKRPHYSPVTGYVQNQSSNGDHYASNSGRSSFTGKEDTDVTDKTRTCNLTSGREIDLEKVCHVSILTENGSISGNNDCVNLSPQSLTIYLQICEKLSNTKLIDIRNDTQHVSDSQIGSTSNKLTVEDSNNRECAEVSHTAEEVRDKRVCMKVYCRKKFKRPYSSSATRYFQGQSANRDEDASSEKSLSTTNDNIDGAGETACHDLTPGRDAIFEKLWCISVLKENGLLGHFPQRCRVMEHQAVVGDGTVDHKCKICDQLEDTGTLICDMCEESFHISCLNPKLISNYVDNWYCPTCKIKKNKDSPRNSQKESKYAYLLRQMLDENVQHKTCVRIGCDYQAEIPEYAGKPSESSESQSIGFVVSLEEEILEKMLSDDNLKNNVWERSWKPANAFSPGTKENWLQCKAIIHKKGDICPDGLRARRNIVCGKWRRAPLSEVQTEKWDCSCAVLWDPRHADCFVPQEIKTAEIQKRNKQSQQRNELCVSSQELQG